MARATPHTEQRQTLQLYDISTVSKYTGLLRYFTTTAFIIGGSLRQQGQLAQNQAAFMHRSYRAYGKVAHHGRGTSQYYDGRGMDNRAFHSSQSQ